MTIDERLEAVAMNLELAYRDIQELREGTRELRDTTRELRDAAGLQALEGAAQRERIDLLVTSVQNLLTVSQSHENRLQRLERRTA
jgi:hypothetical protein